MTSERVVHILKRLSQTSVSYSCPRMPQHMYSIPGYFYYISIPGCETLRTPKKPRTVCQHTPENETPKTRGFGGLKLQKRVGSEDSEPT